MDAKTLATCTGCSVLNSTNWLQPLTYAMDQYEINTPARQAAFLAQVGYESNHLVFTSELWGPTPQQLKYEPPSAVATHLGNTQKGDGFLFRGRGLIMITGRSNYDAVGRALCLNCTEDPDMLSEHQYAAETAAWWWSTHNLNALADQGDFEQITIVINGGTTGEQGREILWNAAKAALGVV